MNTLLILAVIDSQLNKDQACVAPICLGVFSSLRVMENALIARLKEWDSDPGFIRFLPWEQIGESMVYELKIENGPTFYCHLVEGETN